MAAAARAADDRHDPRGFGLQFADRGLLRPALGPDTVEQPAPLDGEPAGFRPAGAPAVLLRAALLPPGHQRRADLVALMALAGHPVIERQIAFDDSRDQVRARHEIPEARGAEQHVHISEGALLVERPEAVSHELLVRREPGGDRLERAGDLEHGLPGAGEGAAGPPELD